MTERYEQLRARALELVRMKERLEGYQYDAVAKSIPGFVSAIEKATAEISSAHALISIEVKKER